MIPVLVHTQFEKDDWEVEFGLLISVTTGDRKLIGTILCPHGTGFQVVQNIEHYDYLVSAHYFVYFDETHKMRADLERATFDSEKNLKQMEYILTTLGKGEKSFR